MLKFFHFVKGIFGLYAMLMLPYRIVVILQRCFLPKIICYVTWRIQGNSSIEYLLLVLKTVSQIEQNANDVILFLNLLQSPSDSPCRLYFVQKTKEKGMKTNSIMGNHLHYWLKSSQ